MRLLISITLGALAGLALGSVDEWNGWSYGAGMIAGVVVAWGKP